MLAHILLATLAAPQAGSDIYIVNNLGGGDFATLADAIDSVPPGAVLLVQSTNGESILAWDKAISILADTGSSISAPFVSAGGTLAAGEFVHLDGILATEAFLVGGTGGLVWIEDVEAQATNAHVAGPAIDVSTEHSTVFSGVSVLPAPEPLSYADFSGLSGLFVTAPSGPSTGSETLLAIYGGEFSAQHGGIASFTNRPGASIVSGYRLFASHSEFLGHNGSPTGLNDFGGCIPAGAPSEGIVTNSPSTLLGSIATPGGPAASLQGCPANAFSAPGIGGTGTVDSLNETARTLDITSVVRPGQQGIITATGDPSDPVWLAVSTRPGAGLRLDLGGVLALNGTLSFVGLGAPDASGVSQLTFSSGMPPQTGQLVFVQGVHLGAAGPRLGQPRSTLLLGGGY